MYVLPLTSEPLQEMTIDLGDVTLKLTVRYNSTGDHWEIDVLDLGSGEYTVQATALVLGVPILWRNTLPYFLWLDDGSGIGLDPIGGSDMGDRIAVVIGLKSEVSA